MTAVSGLTPTPKYNYRFSILRILLCGIFMSCLVAACLYLKYSAVDFLHARLLDQGSKTSAWILKQVSYALPWIFMCLFHAITYRSRDRHDGIAAREKLWEVILVTIFVYLVMLPHLRGISDAMHAAALEAGASIPQTEGKVDQTFIMLFHEWFVRMSVPLVAFLIFFSTRARRERLHPETEAEEPLMTCAEYDAIRRASHEETPDEEPAAPETAESAECAESAETTTKEDAHE